MLGRLAALLVRTYQLTLGMVLGQRCRFHPTCSEYAVLAFRKNGLLAGGVQVVWRLLRCGPWTKGGVDHPADIRLAHPWRAAERGVVRG